MAGQADSSNPKVRDSYDAVPQCQAVPGSAISDTQVCAELSTALRVRT
jgi:hypothetical protein